MELRRRNVPETTSTQCVSSCALGALCALWGGGGGGACASGVCAEAAEGGREAGLLPSSALQALWYINYIHK